MKILYVTTFNKRLFKATGQKMIDSFVLHKTEGDLLIAHEDGLDSVIAKHQKIILYNLEEDEWLPKWLKENEDIIPVYLGGKFKTEDGTPTLNQRFNNRASQWFRKIVALKASLEYDAIVFIDSDTLFIEHLSAEKIEQIFDNASVIYHLGRHRKKEGTGLESGVIGFNLQKEGELFLDIVMEKFKSGSFRKHLRWDDGYIFRMVVEENPNIATKDLVWEFKHGSKVKSIYIEHGPFGEYIVHYKGIHHKRYGINF